MHKPIWVALFVAVCFFASACARYGGGTTTPADTPTAFRSASPTQRPSPTLIATGSPPTTTTVVPTLSEQDARAKFLELLSTNGHCRLPCLWGIEPGRSTGDEARAILEPLSNISGMTSFMPGVGALDPAYEDGDLILATNVSYLYGDDGVVSHVSFLARQLQRTIIGTEPGFVDVFDSISFGERARYYMLPSLLSQLGPPTSVMIATSGGPLTRGGKGGFEILLLYPDQGVLANYTTQMEVVGSKIRGCPRPEDAHLEMDFYPLGQGETFREALSQTDWSVKMGWYKPLEEATSMSAHDFYELFREQAGACIETAAHLWPTPQP